MSRNNKIILGVVAGVLLACLCLAVGGLFAFNQIVGLVSSLVTSDDPAAAAAAGQSMLDYTLPPGYAEQASFDIAFMKMVMAGEGSLESGSIRPVIFLVEIGPEANMEEEELRRQMQLGLRRSLSWQNLDMELVEQSTMTLRGREVSLLHYEGVDGEGNRFKQIISGLFPGKNGLIMLWILGPEQGWDQAEIDGFLQSIR